MTEWSADLKREKELETMTTLRGIPSDMRNIAIFHHERIVWKQTNPSDPTSLAGSRHNDCMTREEEEDAADDVVKQEGIIISQHQCVPGWADVTCPRCIALKGGASN